MRSVLHLLSILLVLPGVVFAVAFKILSNAIASQSWSGFFGHLFMAFVWIFPWGILGSFAALVALALGGFSLRFRWLAALCVVILAVGSSAAIFVLTRSSFSLEQVWLFVPAFSSAVIGLWLAISERPRGKRTLSAA